MQISLLSQRRSSRSPRTKNSFGFTLAELVVSAGIITVVSGILLVRFTSFESATILRSVAYDVATGLREAQIYSVSIINTGSGSSANFRYPYGLHFVDGSPSYTFFRYDSNDTSMIPAYGTNDSVSETVVRAIPLGGSFQLSKICAVGSGIACTNSNNIVTMDISFRRPEFTAIFYSASLDSTQRQNTSAVQLYFNSTRDTSKVWVVEMKLLGQISAYMCTANCS